MSAFAPQAHLASCALNWGVYYTKAVPDVLEKTWRAEQTKWGIKEGVNDFVKLADFVPADAKAAVEKANAHLVENPGAVFVGPLFDHTGKKLLDKGVVGDDASKSAVNFYVNGVEGKVPAGK